MNSDVLKRLNSLQRNCTKHKHKGYTNPFGVSWCIGCGLLMIGIFEPLIDPETKENRTLIMKI